MRVGLIWLALGAVLLWPIAMAAQSPLLAWRDAIYIAGGFAGIIALPLLVLQPLVAAHRLPGLSPHRSGVLHRIFAISVILAVLLHIGGLWVTSPPDVIDVLVFRSPTPFGIWGALAMWALLATALLAMLRRRIRLHPKTWRRLHMGAACALAVTTCLHALLIEGAMEPVSKAMLCAFVVIATAISFRKLS